MGLSVSASQPESLPINRARQNDTRDKDAEEGEESRGDPEMPVSKNPTLNQSPLPSRHEGSVGNGTAGGAQSPASPASNVLGKGA
jgi:hypothetical protein